MDDRTIILTRPGPAAASAPAAAPGSSSRRSRPGGSAASLVALPPVPPVDPLARVLTRPQVPERHRYCPSCGRKAERVQGSCRQCGRDYSFEPALAAGDRLAGQYEVAGPIAYGGLGWIYLARDLALDRWVALKGLLHADDPAALAAAMAERQFLAAIKHPKIVGIHNFVERAGAGYIVMEYVGGQTLKEIRRGRGPLPVAEATASILGILPAFGHLHANGLLYCDFKPSNLMREGDDVKLIDMGAVRRSDDHEADIYLTYGYAAPEAGERPGVTGDLYTIARSLAALVIDFDLFEGHRFTLPSPDEEPLFERYGSLHRFLLRATDWQPDRRFQSAGEMADQLSGVLREIVAIDTGTPQRAESTLFTGDRLVHAGDPSAFERPRPGLLPALKVDPDDPAATDLIAVAGLADPAERLRGLELLAARHPDSAEARLRLAEALTLEDRPDEAEATIAAVATEDPLDWRPRWLQGVAALAAGDPDRARSLFDRLATELPGELAPRLALGLAAEAGGDLDAAIALYDRVARTDPGYASALFGLARCLARRGRTLEAARALERIDAESSLHARAQVAMVELLIGDEQRAIDAEGLAYAEAVIRSLPSRDGTAHELAARLLVKLIGQLERRQTAIDPERSLFGRPFEPRALRRAAESELRRRARFAPTPAERTAWIDRANRIRPHTLL